jgi:hypothetical protein
MAKLGAMVPGVTPGCCALACDLAARYPSAASAEVWVKSLRFMGHLSG